MRLDLNSSATLRGAYSAAMSARIDAAIDKDDASQQRAYVGASAVGDECVRRVQYDVWAGFWPDDPPRAPLPVGGKMRRIWQRGHVFEEMARGWLQAAGITIAPPQRFSVADGQFGGSCDGVVVDGLDDETPCVWENKALNAKNFAAVSRNGVAKAFPKYADQIALYQFHLDLAEHAALFTAVNADTCEIYFERVAFDPARAQAAIDRAVNIIQALRARELLPRVAASADVYPCQWCRWREVCHP